MSSESQYNDEPSFGKPLTIGALLGFVTLTGAGVLIGLRSGYDVPGSIGLAVFAACFGGIGFGCMFGAVYAITRPAAVQTDPALPESAAAPACADDDAQAA